MSIPPSAVALLAPPRAGEQPNLSPLGFLHQALHALATAPPGVRARMAPVQEGAVTTWLKQAEDSAQGSAERALEPPAWAITALARLQADDPLWSSTLALLRALLTTDNVMVRGSMRAPAPPGAAVGALGAMPEPFGGAARAFRERLTAQLSQGAPVAIIDQVFAANALLSPVERPQVCWIPCLIALHAGGGSAPPATWVSTLLDFITAQARQQLSRLPPSIATTWLVGRDPYACCAASLLALLYMRRGTNCYPWTSEAPPKHGRYLVATIGAADPPAGQPANCLGVADLIAEAAKDHALAAAAARFDDAHALTPFPGAAPACSRQGSAATPAHEHSCALAGARRSAHA